MIDIIGAVILGFVCGLWCGWNAGIDHAAKAVSEHVKKIIGEE